MITKFVNLLKVELAKEKQKDVKVEKPLKKLTKKKPKETEGETKGREDPKPFVKKNATVIQLKLEDCGVNSSFSHFTLLKKQEIAT